MKEKKSNIVWFSIITLLLLALQFVIPSQYRDEVKDAPTWMNVLGGLITAGSIVPVMMGFFGKKDVDGASYAKAWIVMMVIGLFLTAGFFDNPHSYLNN